MSARPTTRARLAPARALVRRLKGVVAAALALALLLRAGAEPEFEPLHCVACDAGFFRAQATKACTACPAGSSTFEYSNASSALDCLCAPGFENASELAQASGSCEPCAPAFFKGSLANRSCTACHPDSQAAAAGATLRAQCLCRAGFFFELDGDGEKSCRACAAGTYKGELADAACTQCPANHFCPANAIAPAACPPHSLSAPGSGRVEECLCVEGFFFAYAAGAPADAAGGVAAGYACRACAPGSYTDRAGEPACTACPADTYNPTPTGAALAACLACPAHAASPPNSSLLTQCLCGLGYAGEPGESCTPCAPGQYRENSAVYICEACPPNTFSVRVAADSAGTCLACHANSSSGAGSGSQRECVCDPGLFADAELSCAACAGGSYAPDFNSSACTACEPGKFSAAVGAAAAETCVVCAAGTFATAPGMTACVACPASTWQNASVPAQRAQTCAACPAHSSHARLGETDVFACECAAGYWKAALADAFECRECLPGHFCPGGDRLVPCPFNSFATGGLVTACTPCAPLSRATANASLTGPEQCQCLPGAGGAFHDACAACAPGLFQPRDLAHGGAEALPAQLGVQPESGAAVGAPAALATACAPCPRHTFQNASGASACVACPANSCTELAASADATACHCDPGFFGVSGQACALCLADNYCPGATVMNPCRAHASAAPGADAQEDCKCDGGFFSAAPAAPCALCPPSSYCPGDLAVLACAGASSSPPGARAVSACVCDAGHWRGCIQDAAGQYLDNALLPCAIDYSIACFVCEANDICYNETLKQCPEHSTAPAGSDEDRDCVCDPGFFGLYGADNDA